MKVIRTLSGVILFVVLSNGCCSTSVKLCGTIDGSGCEGKGDIFLCKGDPVYLEWESSRDVHSATLEFREAGASSGTSLGSVSPDGSSTVRAQASGEYAVIARGDCTRESTMTVYVFDTVGQEISLAAHPKLGQKYWEKEIPSNRCSDKIIVTSISPTCGSMCFRHEPILSPYLDCKKYYKRNCNASWYGKKYGKPDIGSFSAHKKLIEYSYPLRGTWQFVAPIPGDPKDFVPKDVAHFILTAECKSGK